MTTLVEALAHLRAGRLREAESIYLKLLAAKPNDADALHYLGVLRHGQRRNDEAVALITRAVAIAPRDANAWNSLGNIVSSIGKLPAAEYAYKRAVEFRPEFFEAWFNLGIVLRSLQKREEAIDAFQHAVALNPKAADAHESIAVMNMHLHRFQEASVAFQRWHDADPDNPIPRHMVTAFTNQAPARAEDAFVTKLFDRMSGDFDAALAKLGYAAPQLLCRALAEFIPFGERRLAILDAGAGTGLCGPLLRSSARQLVGVDLSSGMLEKARARHVYDALHEGELVAFMRAHASSFDVVISADTLVYFGELEAAFAAVHATLSPGGVLAFTLEAEPAGSDARHRLNQNGRYSHREDYVRECLAGAQLTLLQLEPGVLRKEMGADVRGHVVVARK
jgi:predicted TPR repeat methyltransferase